MFTRVKMGAEEEIHRGVYARVVGTEKLRPGKLGNIVAETLLRRQMFPSLAARETYVAETNFAARKQKMFLPGVKNIFASRTQILRPKHMFPSLVTMKTMLTRFQCRSLSKNCFLVTVSVLTTIKMADCEKIEADHAQKKRKGERKELERLRNGNADYTV